MRVIKKVLHEKRKTTEAHIQQLQQAGKQGVRYTAMMPDIPFLMLGLISDIGWMIHLIAGVIYFCRNGFCHVLDYAALLALAGVLFGVAYLIYLNKIHEKEIATKLQKNLSFGITVYSGLAGAVVGMTQITTAGVSSVLVWLIPWLVINKKGPKEHPWITEEERLSFSCWRHLFLYIWSIRCQ